VSGYQTENNSSPRGDGKRRDEVKGGASTSGSSRHGVCGYGSILRSITPWGNLGFNKNIELIMNRLRQFGCPQACMPPSTSSLFDSSNVGVLIIELDGIRRILDDAGGDTNYGEFIWEA
jgi:hypothetical protein